MRRLARHLFTLCSAASLLLCVLATTIWVRAAREKFLTLSYIQCFRDGRLVQAKGWFVRGAPFGVEINAQALWERFEMPRIVDGEVQPDFAADTMSELERESGPRLNLAPYDVSLPHATHLQATTFWNWRSRVGYYVIDDDRTADADAPSRYTSRAVFCPTWVPPVLFALLPMCSTLAFVCRRRRRFRAQRGLCARCGYDVRASPERCPECGTATGKRPENPATGH